MNPVDAPHAMNGTPPRNAADRKGLNVPKISNTERVDLTKSGGFPVNKFKASTVPYTPTVQDDDTLFREKGSNHKRALLDEIEPEPEPADSHFIGGKHADQRDAAKEAQLEDIDEPETSDEDFLASESDVDEDVENQARRNQKVMKLLDRGDIAPVKTKKEMQLIEMTKDKIKDLRASISHAEKALAKQKNEMAYFKAMKAYLEKEKSPF